MVPMRLAIGALAPLLLAALAASGCAKRLPAPVAGPPAAPALSSPEPEAPTPEPQRPPAAAWTTPEAAAPPTVPAEPEVATAAAITAGTTALPSQPRASLREQCRRFAPEWEPRLDATRRRLHETVCGANLWLDTLFGGEPNVENARRVSGRLELSSIYTEVDGNSPKVRLRVNYDLPTLKHRFNLFLGREDPDEAIQDRREPFAVRSSVFGVEGDEKWLTGLGYSPPGRYSDKLDFRLGVRLQSESKIYVQGRYRRNFFVGDRAVVRFRETAFWENREAGFGATTSLDFDRVLRPDLLLRWGNVGTVSEAIDGLAWRSSVLTYMNLRGTSALSAELFVRGETGADVPLREYGMRAIYRRSVLRRWLFGEVIGGYTFPRKELLDDREGSAMIGFGVDLLFGDDPY